MAKDFAQMEDSNTSNNPSIHEVSDPARRLILRGGLGLAAGGIFSGLAGCATGGAASASGPLVGFKSVPVSVKDSITVPEGYVSQALAAWGEPVGIAGNMPAFKFDATNTAAEQEVQMGMHHDGIHSYPLGQGAEGNKRGLLVMNHEYTDDGLLHTDGLKTWSAEKVKKAQAAHGVSVIEVQENNGQWDMVRPSRFARRFTGNSPMTIAGPAAGHALMKTAADTAGTRVLGTLNNCGSGTTPWGTYLTCEENFIGYFSGGDTQTADERRWGLRKGGWGYRWHEHDDRFDATKNPNEINRHGWIVEIDPMDPASTPIKRTAMGRAAHEGATVAVTKDGFAVVYSGEDARFEYIYKFVSERKIRPATATQTAAQANRTLLDDGILYVAKFNADGTGEWLPLIHGIGKMTAANGFKDQGEVVIKTRQASDILGATKMDRPEWIDIDKAGWVYCTLTNNSDRGAANRPGVDAMNPRANNTQGNIIRRKDDGDFDGTTFKWNHFVMAGDPSLARAEAKGNVKGDMFSCPDGLWTDSRGVLWIQTDMSTSAMGKGDLVNMGNNMMLAADVTTGEIRRFLTGPAGCEITGATQTPDGRTMFINIQHPGESPSEKSDPDAVTKISSWPNNNRPRSATVAIRRKDGGVVGT
ncbi:MAG: PhoX family protein [Brachymonas sp.]